MARLVDRDGNALLRLDQGEIFDGEGNLLAVVQGRAAFSLSGTLLGRVSMHGRFVEGDLFELVVVVKELRDAMGRFIGRFEDAAPTERGLLALVYGQLVMDSRCRQCTTGNSLEALDA